MALCRCGSPSRLCGLITTRAPAAVHPHPLIAAGLKYLNLHPKDAVLRAQDCHNGIRTMTPTTSARALVRRGPVLSRAVGRPSGARHGCTKSKSGQAVEKSPESEPTTVTVQGPSWVWLEPVGRPFRAYSRAQARRPYVVQLLSTITVCMVPTLDRNAALTVEDLVLWRSFRPDDFCLRGGFLLAVQGAAFRLHRQSHVHPQLSMVHVPGPVLQLQFEAAEPGHQNRRESTGVHARFQHLLLLHAFFVERGDL